jgi:putative FmdB family regulatory protein
MPTYDYKCEKCENVQEEVHPMRGPEKPVVCAKCGHKKMEKVVGIPYTKFVGDWQTNEVRKIK